MRYVVVGMLLLVGGEAGADQVVRSKAVLNFAEHGFSLEPPVGHDYAQLQQVVSLGLPPSDGFSPNVNVQVQPFKGTIEEYVKISNGEFKANSIKLVSEKHDAHMVQMEYTGQLLGRPLHWYSRAFVGKNGMILVTATATESQWPVVGAALRQSVDSLRLTP
jgi:hypothetical protein